MCRISGARSSAARLGKSAESHGRRARPAAARIPIWPSERPVICCCTFSLKRLNVAGITFGSGPDVNHGRDAAGKRFVHGVPQSLRVIDPIAQDVARVIVVVAPLAGDERDRPAGRAAEIRRASSSIITAARSGMCRCRTIGVCSGGHARD